MVGMSANFLNNLKDAGSGLHRSCILCHDIVHKIATFR